MRGTSAGASARLGRTGERMELGEERPVRREGLQPLSKGEIDRRIERVMAEVTAGGGDAEVLTSATPARRPRWITAHELIERVRPFIVQN